MLVRAKVPTDTSGWLPLATEVYTVTGKHLFTLENRSWPEYSSSPNGQYYYASTMAKWLETPPLIVFDGKGKRLPMPEDFRFVEDFISLDDERLVAVNQEKIAVVEEAYQDPGKVKNAPHRSVVHRIDDSTLDDPDKWAITWRAYLKKKDRW